jgi:hypothetical protein
MAFERWGSLSVADHTDTAALVANVLLYDRLVVPVMPKTADHHETGYWISHGWQPGLQARRLEQLGELAVHRPWDASRRKMWKTRMDELRDERFDAQHIDEYGMTRKILAEEPVKERPPGVHHVDVVAAYNSTEDALRDLRVGADSAPAAAQAILLTRRLAIPDLPDIEDALQVAIDLSSDAGFRQKRADMFDWQGRMIARGIDPAAIVDELSNMTDAYNAAVMSANRKVLWRYAFTIGGIALGLATGGVPFVAGASAGLALLQFTWFDRTPVVEPGSSGPAAMFHDIQTKIGASLQKQ